MREEGGRKEGKRAKEGGEIEKESRERREVEGGFKTLAHSNTCVHLTCFWCSRILVPCS